MQITGVSFADTTTLAVTWTTTQNSVAVNPCNAVVADGPVFIGATANAATGQVASNMSLLKGIAQADDWVNAGQTGTVSPGQPIAVNLTTTNTTCAANVATSRIPRDTYQAASATKGIVGLQGKPQVFFQPAVDAGKPNLSVIQVRSPSPVREYLLTDGAEPPAARPAPRHRLDRQVPQLPPGLAVPARRQPGGQREPLRRVPQPGRQREERPGRHGRHRRRGLRRQGGGGL